MDFGLECQTKLTQVLFLKFRCNEVKLEHHSGDPQLATARQRAGVSAYGVRKFSQFPTDRSSIRFVVTCDGAKDTAYE